MTTTLADVCTITMGQAPSGSSYNDRAEGLPLIAGAGDFKGGVLAPTKFTTEPGKVSKPGDIVLSIRASIGAKVWADGEYCLGRGVAALRARPELDDKYLWHWLTRSERDLASKGRGATFLQVNKNDISEMPIVVPPLDEQRRIAAILDQADAIRAKRRQALAHIDDLNQSIFRDMFGDRRSVMNKWPVQPLGDLLEFLTSGSRGWAKYYAETGSLFLRIQNVRRDALVLDDIAFVDPPKTAEAKRTRVRAGDVLLSITADLGRTAVVPEGLGDAFINQHLSILRVPDVLPEYLSAFLTSAAGQEQILGRNRQGVKAGLNFDDVRSFSIPMPPHEAQEKFVRAADAVRARQQAAAASTGQMDELRHSLQTRAFRGDL